MTLVYRAKKPQIHNQFNPLGPGQYFSTKQNISKNHLKNTSSFASSSNRNLNNTTQRNPGPGSYNIKHDCLIQNKVSNCKAVFQSKISRLDHQKKTKLNKCPNQECQKLVTKSSAFWKDQSDKGKPLGKVYKGEKYCNVLKDSKMAKSIPSIPTWQQSYGYRMDEKSHELIQNKNPNILIAHQQNILTNKEWQNKGPGYYFIRDDDRKGGHQWSKSNSQRSLMELKHCLQFPAPNHYSIKSQLSRDIFKTTNLPKDQRFHLHTSNKHKQMLLLKKMKRQFADYLEEVQHQEKDIKEKSNLYSSQKKQQTLPHKRIHKKDYAQEFSYNKCKKQCFNSQEPRFKQTSNQKCTQQAKSIKIDLLKKNADSSLMQTKKSEQFIKQGKIIPFGGHGDRFKSDHKQNLGPGSYCNNNYYSSIKKGVCISFNQSRFEQDRQSHQKPGPGSYNVQKQYTNMKKPKMTQSKYCLRNFVKNTNDITQQSIQKLYNSYGRQVNFYLKQSKLANCQQKNDTQIQRNMEAQNAKRAAFLSTVQRDCMKIIQKQNQNQIPQRTAQKKFRNKQIIKHKKKEFYFNAPDKPDVPPGPGEYQIQGKIQKKTYNVTYSHGKSDAEMMLL